MRLTRTRSDLARLPGVDATFAVRDGDVELGAELGLDALPEPGDPVRKIVKVRVSSDPADAPADQELDAPRLAVGARADVRRPRPADTTGRRGDHR